MILPPFSMLLIKFPSDLSSFASGCSTGKSGSQRQKIVTENLNMNWELNFSLVWLFFIYAAIFVLFRWLPWKRQSIKILLSFPSATPFLPKGESKSEVNPNEKKTMLQQKGNRDRKILIYRHIFVDKMNHVVYNTN